MVSAEEDDSSDVEILDTWPKAVPSGMKCSAQPITGKEKQVSSSNAHLKSQFVEMGFSPTLVDKVIQENGEDDAHADVLLETLCTYTEVGSKTSSGMQKKRCLHEMGFSEDEISRAIDNFGSGVEIHELADAIFANQIARSVAAEEQKENQNESGSLHNAEEQARGLYQGTNEGCNKRSGSDSTIYESNEFRRKRHKYVTRDGGTASNSNLREGDRLIKQESDGCAESSRYNWLKYSTEINSLKVNMLEPNISKFDPLLSKPLYLFYGNVLDISQETWKRLSHFLNGIEPELVDSQSFSAIIRNEGYIHNLPMRKRVHIHPMPSVTVQEALPHTKKWWPSWDTRKKLSCISLESKEALVQCERLEKMMRSSQVMLSKEKEMEILHQCRAMNLIWTGQHKLSPVTPEEVECILGYPQKHTDVWGVSLDERLRALMRSFQINTVAYHLSVLKGLYPEGINVLSIFSGIGGAEMALCRLGVHLKHVVSVEPVESNQEILRRWWRTSGQAGELIEIKDIKEMSWKKIGRINQEIGGFDIVIGSNPCVQLPKIANRDGSAGVNFSLFCEFVRVYLQVKSILIKR